MIRLNFMVGGSMRRVLIEDRIITFLCEELNDVPLKLNLDKLNEEKEKIKQLNFDVDELKKISKLKTERQIADDIIEDFKKTGWRLVGRGHS